MKEKMIKDFMKSVTSEKIDVEIIGETPVLSKDGWWHIYFLSDRMVFIGTCDDGDFELLRRIASVRTAVLDIVREVRI